MKRMQYRYLYTVFLTTVHRKGLIAAPDSIALTPFAIAYFSLNWPSNLIFPTV
jgi:hypothetical protein